MIDTIRLRLHGCNQQKKGIFNKTISERTGKSLMLVESHNQLFNALNLVKRKGFVTTTILSNEKLVYSDAPFEEVLSMHTSNQINEHYITTNRIRFSSEDVVKERNLSLKGRYSLDSSESDVTFLVNYEGGFIDFEFSIPKYLYGHNLAQFIPQCRSNTYRNNSKNINDFDFQKHLLFDRLDKFIKLFFTDLFINLQLEELPNYNYVEIRRLDICYNQYFETKEDAILYLQAQKKFAKKSKILSPLTNTDWETTIAFRTQRGNYFKIYHKGTEYLNQKHGDFHKHNKINNDFINYYVNKNIKSLFPQDAFFDIDKNEVSQKIQTIFKKHTKDEKYDLTENEKNIYYPILNNIHKKLPIDTDYLKSEMDKILRYEMSISGKALSYYYKTYAFRVNDKVHQNAKRIYKSVKSNLELKRRNKKTKNTKIIPQYAMEIYDEYQRWISRATSLVMSDKKIIINNSINSARDYNPENDSYKIGQIYSELGMSTILETLDTYHFNSMFLNKCVSLFKEQIIKFQIQEIEPFDDLKKRVIRFNEIVDNNIKNYKQGNILPISKMTQTERIKRNFKKISYSNLVQIFNLIHVEKKSMNEIRQLLMLSNQQFYRRLTDLKMLGISETAVSMTKTIKPRIDFLHYYFYTSITKNSNKFYNDLKHLYYD